MLRIQSVTATADAGENLALPQARLLSARLLVPLPRLTAWAHAVISFFLSLSDEGGVSLVEMLHCTSLIALVGAGEQAAFSPRRLRIFNTKTEKYICELNFLSTVLQVRLSYSHLVAVLERKIHLFDLRSMKMLHTLDTASSARDRPLPISLHLVASLDSAAAFPI